MINILIDMQIKTEKGYYLTLVRMAIIKKSTNKFWRGYGEKKPFYTVEQVSKLHQFSCIWLCDPIDCSPARLLCPWDSPDKSRLSCLPPWDLPNTGTKPRSPAYPALQAILYH